MLCAVVSDALHESPISVQGGALVDLGHCGRADDQWSVGLALRNLGRENVPAVDALQYPRCVIVVDPGTSNTI